MRANAREISKVKEEEGDGRIEKWQLVEMYQSWKNSRQVLKAGGGVGPEAPSLILSAVCTKVACSFE